MQFAVLLGVLAAAIASPGGFYEPGVDLNNLCMICGDPVVRTNAGKYVMITKEQKTLLSRWNSTDINCKFMLRVVTRNDHADDADLEPLYADWIGFNFGKHPNSEKFDQRWLLSGTHPDTIGRSGRKFSGLLVQNMPQTWPDVSLVTPALDPGMECHQAFEAVSAEGEPMIKVRSDCCPFAINFYPRKRDTCIEFWTGDYYFDNGEIEGLCGKQTGTVDKDDNPITFDEPGFDQLTTSFFEGSHQGDGFEGGRRMGEPGFTGDMSK